MKELETVNVHLKVSQETNNRVKQLTVSEEARTGKRALIKDKYIQCLEDGLAHREKLETN
jgi:hypothetical protein